MWAETEKNGKLILLTSPALVGATERIGFKTDIFESKNGTEVRIPLKDKARQSLSFSSLALAKAMAQYFNVQWGGIRANWAVPLFQEGQKVGDVDSDLVLCRTDIYSFYEGGLALLKNDKEQVLVEILEVKANSLLFSKSIDIQNAKLYPVRICFVNGDIGRQVNAVSAQALIDFIVIDEPETEESIPPQFLSEDIYFFKLTFSGDALETKLIQQQNVIDNEVGHIFQNTDWSFARYSKQYRTILKSQQQLYEYKQFLFRRMGKYRPFWLPTYEMNMRCKSTGFISSVMLIESDQYKQLSNRKHIAIKSNGMWTAHVITASAIISATTTQISFSPALNKNADSIQLISYLGLHRLDADSVQLNYRGANIVEAVVPILEIGV